ncbi:97a51818-5cb3-47fe-8406-d826c8d3a218 [Thermothielavioides terrestris]|uniref:Queuosine 5'-phosphate N-glycosylase/hydrolase n=1 Tax=Thermothielavioides terrestris TaxID=2587410 RepID=A0A3S4AL74_9PEZI|nr:97a51818-5cb3-47fe-8406-d826c8d3a218 [Thermothielavioides terrestris]
MSDDEADPELLALLRQHLQGKLTLADDPETGVLEGAEYVYDNATDVALDMRSCKNAAAAIYEQMQRKQYKPAAWSAHELHPDRAALGEQATVAFIFTMDLLNFSFWSERSEADRFAVEYRGKRWTGYWSLVAALRRALDEGIPITDSHFWQDEEACTLDALKQVFRSCTDEEMPLLAERLACLREAGQVLYEKYQCNPVNLIEAANGSAAGLVNLLARDFSCFRDEHVFEGRRKPVRFLKRAQILVADLWACFEGEGYGEFRDIDKITMFADYRVPQILNSMGCLIYSPPLETAIRAKREIPSGGSWELQLRACSIWCVELIRREIAKAHPGTHINAILIDFFLYDTMKEMEAAGKETVPHHRTRSIWY